MGQSIFSRLNDHRTRFLRQAGRKVAIGNNKYQVRGYISNNFSDGTTHEPQLHNLLERLLPTTKGTFVDVGVNLGQTLSKVVAIDPDREFLGFEPQIAACFYVNRFLADNNLKHMNVLPIGLSDSNEMAVFYARGEADTMASSVVTDIDTKTMDKSFVQMRIGDDLLPSLLSSPPGIIKIDVEGAEINVLRGLTKTITQHAPIILFEVLPNFKGHDKIRISDEQANARTNSAEEIRAYLTGINYTISQIHADGTDTPIDEFDLNDPTKYVGNDYIARHSDHSAA